MGYLRNAEEVLIQAQGSLRKLIEQALANQAYGEVAGIARLADALVRLVSERGDTSAPPRELVSPESVAADDAIHHEVEPSGSRATRKRKPSKGEFPRFERDSDRLVKIGWSKRDERVYEHRAPREVVLLVSAALSKLRPRSVFTMDQVLPLNDNGGNEVPSYQAYLVLAWLRSLAVVQRRGKEGYTVANGSLEPSKLQRLWDAIPTRD